MTRSGRTLLLLLVVSGMGLVLGLDAIERSFIYFPARPVTATPAQVGLAFEDVSFTAADGVVLHGWFVPGPERITWVWFHGNAGNIGHRVRGIHGIHRALGGNVFIFDYRGYGRSSGTPSEEGLYTDAEAALDVLRARADVDAESLIYFGESLGAAVAVEVATRHPPRGLVLEGAFSSIPAMARLHYPFMPIRPLVRSRYDALSKIPRVAVPLLVIHGERDDIAPIEMATELFEAAREPKTFLRVPGAGHNDASIVGGERYYGAIEAFVGSLSR